MKENGELQRRGIDYPTPNNQCRPGATPYLWAIQFEIELLQSTNEVTILYSEGPIVRHVRMNARHPAQFAPTWQGDSVGHYEGDALVVDTVGIKTGPIGIVDSFGTPHSQALHVVERFRLIGAAAAKEAADRGYSANGHIYPGDGIVDTEYKGNGLQVQFTVDDTAVFTTPWSGLVTFRHSGRDFPEWICAENTHEYYSGNETDVPKADKPDF